MDLNSWSQTLVIILSIVLIVFLIVGIVLGVSLYKLVKKARTIANSAEEVANNIVEATRTVKNSIKPTMIMGSIIESIRKVTRAKGAKK